MAVYNPVFSQHVKTHMVKGKNVLSTSNLLLCTAFYSGPLFCRSGNFLPSMPSMDGKTVKKNRVFSTLNKYEQIIFPFLTVRFYPILPLTNIYRPSEQYSRPVWLDDIGVIRPITFGIITIHFLGIPMIFPYVNLFQFYLHDIRTISLLVKTTFLSSARSQEKDAALPKTVGALRVHWRLNRLRIKHRMI